MSMKTSWPSYDGRWWEYDEWIAAHRSEFHVTPKSVSEGPLLPCGPSDTDSAIPAGAAGGVTPGRSGGTSPAKPLVDAKMSQVQVAFAVLKGDLDLAIRGLERMRRGQAFSQELRMQLGRCLYELQRARRIAGA